MQKFDVLIIGSGLAGQSAALRLASSHCSVVLVSKRSLEDSASGWAQGGIAAVLDSRDSIEAHIQDTLVAVRLGTSIEGSEHPDRRRLAE